QAECFGAAELAGSQLRVGPRQAVKQQQQALLAAPWLDLVLLVLAEDQPANTIVVAQRSPADQACSLCRKYRLEHQAAAEEQPWALFNEDINRAFAFFVKQLGVRLLGACRNPPVDGAHIVASLIDAHLIEIHAATAQLGVVQADQGGALLRAGKQRDFADPVAHVDQLGKANANARGSRASRLGRSGGRRGVHQATATTSRMR